KSSQELLRKDFNGITWDQAQDACKPHGLANREGYLRESGILNNHEFWIGKTIDRIPTRWIELIAHSFTSVIKHEHATWYQASDSCGNDGLEFEESIFNEVGTLHGKMFWLGKAIYSKTSDWIEILVYQGNVSNHKGRQCTTLNCRDGHNNLKAENCTLRDNRLAGRCGNKDIGSWGKTFESSLIRCISKNQLLLAPLHYCNKNGNKNEAVTSWTNVFRDVWNRQLTKAEGGYDHPLQCLAGELVQVDGLLQLNKTRKDCNEVLDWFVCKSGSGYRSTQINPFNRRVIPAEAYVPSQTSVQDTKFQQTEDIPENKNTDSSTPMVETPHSTPNEFAETQTNTIAVVPDVYAVPDRPAYPMTDAIRNQPNMTVNKVTNTTSERKNFDEILVIPEIKKNLPKKKNNKDNNSKAIS
ncbi:Hypothetical predicted protein, partial [Mytilus galloprovincialis]